MTGKKPRPKPAKADTRRRKIGPEAKAQAMVLLAEGFSLAAVGVEMGVNRDTVLTWRDSPDGQRLLADARKAREGALKEGIGRARKVLEEGAILAAQTLVDAATHGPTKDRIRAAATLLDRIGVPRTERVEVAAGDDEDLTVLTDDELAEYERLLAKTRKAT